ncbi:MAG: DUF2868 domain-containing protein [Firmicutes bacterium]|nr:DUF2868 domain-containing protein [Bacillota bacterium]
MNWIKLTIYIGLAYCWQTHQLKAGMGQAQSHSHFRSHWTSAVIRRIEATQGPFADAEAIRHARTASNFEHFVQRRAEQLAQQHQFDQGIRHVTMLLRVSYIALLLFAGLSGVGLAISLTPQQAGAVSVVEAIVMLIVVNGLFIVLWGIANLVGNRASSPLGWGFHHLLSKLRNPVHVNAALGLSQLIQQQRLIRPGLGTIAHSMWLTLLSAAWMTLFVRFVVADYQFSWPTTLLSEQHIQMLVATLHTVPAWFGLSAPNIEQGGSFNPQQTAWWLLTCVLLYAVAPRILCWLGCKLWLRQRVGTLTINPTLPGYSELLPAFEQRQVRVVDPAPAELHMQASSQRKSQPSTQAVNSTVALVYYLDWPEDDYANFRHAWQQQPTAVHCELVNSGAQRQHALNILTQGPNRPLLVVVNARLSPERGSLRFIQSLTKQGASSRQLHIALVNARPETGSQRTEMWREYLTQHVPTPLHIESFQVVDNNWVATVTELKAHWS